MSTYYLSAMTMEVTKRSCKQHVDLDFAVLAPGHVGRRSFIPKQAVVVVEARVSNTHHLAFA